MAILTVIANMEATTTMLIIQTRVTEPSVQTHHTTANGSHDNIGKHGDRGPNESHDSTVTSVDNTNAASAGKTAENGNTEDNVDTDINVYKDARTPGTVRMMTNMVVMPLMSTLGVLRVMLIVIENTDGENGRLDDVDDDADHDGNADNYIIGHAGLCVNIVDAANHGTCCLAVAARLVIISMLIVESIMNALIAVLATTLCRKHERNQNEKKTKRRP